jgi:molecular chaperone DnaK (HSP70)
LLPHKLDFSGRFPSFFNCIILHFFQRITDWLASNFKKDEGIDLLKHKQALQWLTEASEKAKMELSTLSQTNIK